MLQADSWTAFGRHVAHLPQDPWLFYPEPPDWRWISRVEGLHRLEGVRNLLLGEGSGSGSAGAAAFRYLHEVPRFVVDLAVRSCGLISAPLSGGTLDQMAATELDRRGIGLWLGSCAASDGPPSGLEVPMVGFGPQDSGSAPAGDRGGDSVVGGAGRVSGAQVMDRARAVHTLTAAGLELGATRLAEALPAAPRGAGSRHIVLHWRSLEDPGERLLMTWAVRSGAAIVLVPESLGVLYALRWCRPTLLQGTAAELSRLAAGVRSEMGGSSRRRLLRHFRRLSAVVALDSEADASAVELWQELGASVVGLPAVLGKDGEGGTDLFREGDLPDNIAW